MRSIKLVVPNKDLFSAFRNSVIESRGAPGENVPKTFPEYVRHLEDVRRGKSFPVPYTEFWILLNNETLAGHLQIRHRRSASKALGRGMASHLYVELHPKMKDHLCLSMLLNLILEQARKIGLREIEITCNHADYRFRNALESHSAKQVTQKYVPKRRAVTYLYKLET